MKPYPLEHGQVLEKPRQRNRRPNQHFSGSPVDGFDTTMGELESNGGMQIDSVNGIETDWVPHAAFALAPKPKAAFMPSREAIAFPPPLNMLPTAFDPAPAPPHPPPPPKFDNADPYSLPDFSSSTLATPALAIDAATGNAFIDFDFNSGATTSDAYINDPSHSPAAAAFVDPFDTSLFV